MMKKSFGTYGCRIAALLLGLCLLTACGDQGEKNYEKMLSPDKPVILTVWTYYNGNQQTAFDALVQEFNETVGAQKGIVLESFSQGSVNELADEVLKAANETVGAQRMPDIFLSYADSAREVDELGMLADLDSYFTEEELQEYVSAYVEEGRIGENGGLRILPIAKSTEVLVFNATDFARFSQETGMGEENLATWEGLVKMAETYYEWSNGKAFFGRDAMANYMLLGSMQLGHEIFPVEGKQVSLDFDQETMRRLWEHYYVPFVKGYYASGGRYASDDAKEGSILALVGSTSGAAYFPTEVFPDDESSYRIEGKVLPVPAFEGTKSYAVQQGAGMAVSRSEPVREYASAVFLKWFTEAERNMEFAAGACYLPVKRSANDAASIGDMMRSQESENAEVMAQTMKVSVQEVMEYELYTPNAFEGGAECRAILESAMSDAAKADRAAVEEQLGAGVDRAAALAPYLSEERFLQWYEQTKKELEDVLDYEK